MVSRWTLPNRRRWRAASLFVVLALILLLLPRVALARAPVGPELGANPTSSDIFDATAPTAALSAVPTSGPAPLTVQFSDESTGDPTGWAWYFSDEAMDGAWAEMTADAEWSERLDHTSVALPDGSIVLMGGDITGGGYGSDVWRSTDQGVTWTQMTDDAAWFDRIYHSSVALPDGSIVVMGGYGDDDTARNDVWRSTDQGATWTLMTANAEWGVRWSHTSVALPDGSIVLMGGEYADLLGDVWRSTDQGATWTQMTASAAWPGRRSHASVVLPDGSIVLMGGNDGDSTRNDVWRSTDQGATWAQMTANAGWTARHYLASVALPDGSIVLMGGHDSGFRNDVWRSIDQGATWSLLTGPTSWLPRRSHTAVALPDGSIVFMGGAASGSGRVNDVWRLETAGSTEQHPSHVYAEPGIYSVALQEYNDAGYSSLIASDHITVTIPPPVAAFSAAPTRTQPGLDVEFTDESTGDPTGWAWYFSDEAMDGAWVEMTASAEWSARNAHTSVVLPDGSIVLIGGQDDGGLTNDVWRSVDQGATWTQMTDDAEWTARANHTSVALPDGSIVLMGGRAGTRSNDVWRSTDQGVTWMQMTAAAEWTARWSHTSVALPDGAILLMGGDDGGPRNSDVWRSIDQGATWSEVTDSAGWAGRERAASAVLPDGSIVLMGGNDGYGWLNDVWRSEDQGETWTQMTAGAAWSERGAHSIAVLPDGSIVLTGGIRDIYSNDVWRSTDRGATWTRISDGAEWSNRYGHTSVVLPDGTIVLMGGAHGRMNDVWRLETAGSYEQHPSHSYAEAGIYSVTLQAYNQGGSSRAHQDAYITVGWWMNLPLLMR